ncbi:MAG TPA: intradiol ring-cleavage dioxygenase [Burkholderiaceae bacterium]|nr:intradiol ring-cleavage dioxygenase [Burkholderiaceae bacterium]
MVTAEDAITAAALERLQGTPDARLRAIMQSLIRHLHAFVRDVELSEEEWCSAIQFLTETGQKCDGKVRQEFILLSDVLGVSMLVDAINHRKPAGATESTVFGPFYIADQPRRALGENMAIDARMEGEAALIHGTVCTPDGAPIAGATLDVWQTATNGMYSGQDTTQPEANLRGKYTTDANGYYAIRTLVPVAYPIPTDGPVGRLLQATRRAADRPAHVHFMVSAAGCKTLVTHLFRRGDRHLDADPVFGVKESLIVDFTPRPATSGPGRRFGIEHDFLEARYDFVLERK